MPRKTFVQVIGEDGKSRLVEKAKWTPPDVAAPFFMPDITEARSPIDGTLISSRPVRDEHNRRNDVVDVGNDASLQRPKPWVEPTGVREDIQRALQETGGY